MTPEPQLVTTDRPAVTPAAASRTRNCAGERKVPSAFSSSLAGTLTVELAPGFTPALGATFNVISYAGRTGEFQSVKLPDLGAGRKLSLVYGRAGVALSVVAQ